MDVISSLSVWIKSIKLFFVNLFSLLLPIGLLCVLGYLILYSADLTPGHRLYVALIAGVIAIVSSLYPLRLHAYIAYGMALGGFSLLYGACYQAYVSGELDAQHLFYYIMIINMWALITAMRFRGWLLAVLSITVAGALPTILIQSYFTPKILLIYFLIVLGLILLVAYVMEWFELVALGFLWYLLYNPFLFQVTTLEPKQELLSLNEVLYAMGVLFVIYTGIPWLHSLSTNKQRVFDSLCVTLTGAYTFAMSRFVINSHLVKVKELPFFIKMLVRDVPSMTNIQVQMFFIYAVVYGVLFAVLLLINKRSIVVLATLANLCCLSLFGLIYVHSNTFTFVSYLIQFHKVVINAIS